MKSIPQSEKRKIVILFLTPALVLASLSIARSVVSYFQTPELIKWISFQNDEWTQEALLKGANPNARTPDGWTMVMWTVGNNGNIAIIKMLKNAGARTDATEDLFIAVLENDEGAARAALQQGAKVNAVEKDGWTPLMWAACRTHPKIVQLLLNSGANPRWKSKKGETALSVVCHDLFHIEPPGCGPMTPCPAPAVCTETEKLLHNALKLSTKRQQR